MGKFISLLVTGTFCTSWSFVALTLYNSNQHFLYFLKILCYYPRLLPLSLWHFSSPECFDLSKFSFIHTFLYLLTKRTHSWADHLLITLSGYHNTWGASRTSEPSSLCWCVNLSATSKLIKYLIQDKMSKAGEAIYKNAKCSFQSLLW